MKAGQQYKIEVRLNNEEFVTRGVPFFCRGGIRLGAVRHITGEEGLEGAVKLAKDSDGKHFPFLSLLLLILA